MKALSFDDRHCQSVPFFSMHDDEEDDFGKKNLTTPNRQSKTCFIIGVCGGTASGKTSVCTKIMEQLEEMGCHSRVAIISQDSYYKGLTPEQSAKAAEYNFDHPNAFDWDLIKEHLLRLKQYKPIDVPTYSFVTHSRVPNETTTLFSVDVVLFEGIMSFWEESIRNIFDMKVFVDTEDDIRLIRRIRRDTKSRGRTLESVLDQYEQFVKPAFDQFIAPTKKFADVVVPRGETNVVAISLITMHIRDVLERAKKR